MEKTLTIKWGNSEIFFSDLDHDNEIEINLENTNGEDISVFIDKEKIILIRDHLNYILSKILKEHQGEARSVSSQKEAERICPKCGCQIYDPFTGTSIIHDVAKCSGK